MHFAVDLLVALLATSALAAPAPSLKQKDHKASLQNKNTFKIPSRARPNNLENVDTLHEMSRAFAKFNFDLVLASPHGTSSTTLSVPDVPQIVSDLLGGHLSHPTHGPKAKTSRPWTTAAVYSAVPYITSVSSEYVPASTEASAPISESTEASSSTAVEVSTTVPEATFSASTEASSSTVAEISSTVPETTAPASTEASSSMAAEVSGTVSEATVTASTEASSSTAAEISSTVSETTVTASTEASSSTTAETTAASETTVTASTETPSSTVAETSAAPESVSSSDVADSTVVTSSSTIAASESSIYSAAPTATVTPESTAFPTVSSSAAAASPTESFTSVSTSSTAPISVVTSESSALPVVSTAAPPAVSATPSTVSSESVPTTLSTSSTLAPTTTTQPASSTTTQKIAATVGTTPESNDSEYLSPVTIGGQPFNLNFDTGSADLWVFSSGLNASQISGHAVFDPSKSSTWQPANGYSWQISYGDGSAASGSVGFDAVVIGGATATRQAIELATQVSDSFVKDANNDGLVGLGWSNINTIKPTPQKTFFENIMADLVQPLFTADLRQDASGSYEFGTIDAARYTGDIHYTSIDNSKGFWEFPSTSYSINNVTYQNAYASPAIADTGTSIILADSNAVTAYYTQVQGAVVSSTAGGYVFPCSATLPDFGVAIGDSGFIANIPGADLVYSNLNDGTCFGGIQSNAGISYQIFGDVLLKQYFAVFNGGAKTFGVATKA